jgi:hypothetical protein
VGIDRHGKRRGQVNRRPLAAGKALVWPPVDRPTNRDGPVHLALGRPTARNEAWWVGSEAPTESQTCEADGRRVALAEKVLADQSTGFQLASSLLRSATALARLGCRLAITTLYLVAPGSAVVTQGNRRWVDSQGCRGQRSVKIGGRWVKLAISRGDELMTGVH